MFLCDLMNSFDVAHTAVRCRNAHLFCSNCLGRWSACQRGIDDPSQLRHTVGHSSSLSFGEFCLNLVVGPVLELADLATSAWKIGWAVMTAPVSYLAEQLTAAMSGNANDEDERNTMLERNVLNWVVSPYVRYGC